MRLEKFFYSLQQVDIGNSSLFINFYNYTVCSED